jgi:hypothetical protein
MVNSFAGNGHIDMAAIWQLQRQPVSKQRRKSVYWSNGLLRQMGGDFLLGTLM